MRLKRMESTLLVDIGSESFAIIAAFEGAVELAGADEETLVAQPSLHISISAALKDKSNFYKLWLRSIHHIELPSSTRSIQRSCERRTLEVSSFMILVASGG